MGMGEPMLNSTPCRRARRLPDLGITHRRTTISTVGWLPGCALRRRGRGADPARALAARGRARAALGADAVNDRYPLRHSSPSASATSSCAPQGLVEYVMLGGVNDRIEQARALADLLDPRVSRST
jgi:23S rRNA (adenine2503-C2)-methyltransferase